MYMYYCLYLSLQHICYELVCNKTSQLVSNVYYTNSFLIAGWNLVTTYLVNC